MLLASISLGAFLAIEVKTQVAVLFLGATAKSREVDKSAHVQPPSEKKDRNPFLEAMNCR